jgi:hypothetical protein
MTSKDDLVSLTNEKVEEVQLHVILFLFIIDNLCVLFFVNCPVLLRLTREFFFLRNSVGAQLDVALFGDPGQYGESLSTVEPVSTEQSFHSQLVDVHAKWRTNGDGASNSRSGV